MIRFRQDGSANAVLGAMTQFLLFGVGPRWVSEQVAMSLAKPKFLRLLPDGAAGEGGGARVVTERTLKFATTDSGVEYFTPEQVELMIRMARNARYRFLMVLMRATGLRIGETLACGGPMCISWRTRASWAATKWDGPPDAQMCPRKPAERRRSTSAAVVRR
ncbi:hypothetical protein [Streptomyces sp. NPDC002671]